MTAELLAELDLPADHLRAVRLAAGRIAQSEGFDEDTAEDIKLAVGEVCSRLQPDIRMQVTFRRVEAALEVAFPEYPGPAQPARADGDPDLGWLIVEAVVPQISSADGALRLSWPLPQ